MSSWWSYLSPTDWKLTLQENFHDYSTTLVEYKENGELLKLLAIFIVTLALTVTFLRYLWRFLYPSQLPADLFHFKAAPAGDRAAVISIQGQRKYMEDTYQAIPHLEGHSNWSYYGVYDGHGGARCSVYVAHYLHKHVLAWIDAYIAHYSSNSTRLLAQLTSGTSNNSNTKNTNGANQNSNCNENGTVNSNVTPNGSNSNSNQTRNETSNIPSDLNRTIISEDPCNPQNTGNTGNTVSNNSNSNPASTVNSNNANPNPQMIRQRDADSIPQCIVRIMKEILLKSHRKADQEFLQLADRQRWKDGSTAVSCVMVPGKDLIAALIEGAPARNGTESAATTAGATSNSKEDEKRRRDVERAVSGLSPSDHWMFVANTGDSRGILVSTDGGVVEMSKDHKPNSDSERHRITAGGGRVVFFGTWRVEGILAVSRSFGDRLLKQWIIPDPEVVAHRVDGTRDLFLILATDGVWDTVSNQEAAHCALESWNDPKQHQLSLNQRLRAIAQKITSFAYTRGSMDNITTLVVHLPSHCAR